jgi:hypothetical protein
MTADVLAMLKPVLADFGAEADPPCWVVWGEDPEARYSILVPTIAGLITAAIRTANQGGTPRATAKLVRWPKLSVSELNLESSGGHRIVAVQVETLFLKGVDEEADRICEFVRDLMAEVDDRHAPQAPIAYFAADAVDASAAPVPATAPAPVAAAAVPERAPLSEPVSAAAQVEPASEEPTRMAPSMPVEASAAHAQPVVAAAAPVAAAPAARPAADTQPAVAAPAAKAAPAPKPKPARAAPAAATRTPLAPAVKPDGTEPTAPGTGLVYVPGPAAVAAAQADAPAAKARSTREKPELEPEPEPDRSKWIPSDPVGRAAPHKPAKPRPWRP